MKRRIFSAVSYGMSAALLLLCFLIPMQGVDLPDRISLSNGEEAELMAGLPISATLSVDGGSGLSVNGKAIDKVGSLPLNKRVTLSASDQTQAELSLSLGNLFTIKRIQVTGDKERYLYPGGQSIGVAMYTKGALIIASGEFIGEDGKTVCPGRDAGLLAGDIIMKVNGKTVSSADHLSKMLNEKNEAVTLSVMRDGKQTTTVLTPEIDASDGAYRAGLWVRDSTAGIGTMTFIDPKSKAFGSLGHAITDPDLREILQLSEGAIVPAKVFSVIKGEVGSPGELCGTFMEDETSAGTITKNTDYGVFGAVTRMLENGVYSSPLPVADQSAIKTGPATILSTIDENGVQEYRCEIVRINRQKNRSTKGLVIRVTDPRLLKSTGGIVRGMSGSPILQNGKIVGAVTHVFVNDPQRGYGVFIEWMLDEVK